MMAFPRSTSEAEGLPQELKINKYMVFYNPNGRFAVTPGFFNVNPWAMQDLDTGNIWTSITAPLTTVSSVSNNGTLLGVYKEQVTVWRPGGEIRDLMPAHELLGMQVSANSAVAIVELGTYQTKRTLWWIDIKSKERRVIAEVEPDSLENIVLFSLASRTLSDDGTRVLFYAEQQLKLFENGKLRSLFNEPEELLYLTLSEMGGWRFTHDALRGKSETRLPRELRCIQMGRLRTGPCRIETLR